MDFTRKMQRLKALEEEQKKIKAFETELPLSLDLVTQAIESCRSSEGQSERTTSACGGAAVNRKQRRVWKSELHGRFLWALQQLRGTDVATPKQIKDIMQVEEVDDITIDEVKNHLQKYRLLTGRPIIKKHKSDQSQNQGLWKQKRIWTEELHGKFLSAIEKLGGPDVSTPMKIRDVMKVDGLTKEEINSHLQKYRVYLKKQQPQGSPSGREN